MAATGPKPNIAEFPDQKRDPDAPALEPPKKLTTNAEKSLWQRYIAPAHWLSDGDTLLAYTFVIAYAEYMKKPREATAAEKAELRRQMGELGLTSSERTRREKKGGGGKTTDADALFD